MRRVLLAAALAVLAGSAQAESELSDVGCAEEARLRSVDSAMATEVIFFNQSGAVIRTYWLDFQGQRKFRAEIPPGGSFVQQTYVNHPWLITNTATKSCVGIFQPMPAASIVVIQ
jgi:outer membrane lipoprotein-sorting protein